MHKPVTFIIRKDGVECKYSCSEGEDCIDYDLLYEVDTSEENGVQFSIELEEYEYNRMINKAKKKLAYYKTVILTVEGEIWNNTVYRYNSFQFCDTPPYHTLHLSLGDVVYTLDYDKLDIPVIHIPLCLRFNLDSGISPTPSREDFIYDKSTIHLIKNKIKEVAEDLCEKYNFNNTVRSSFKESLNEIGSSNRWLVLDEVKFLLNDILGYSSVKTEELNIQGFNGEHLIYLKKRYEKLARNFTCLGKCDSRRLSRMHTWGSFYGSGTRILLDGVISATMRDYIFQNYTNSTIFKKAGDRKLWMKSESGIPLNNVEAHSLCYYNMLDLREIPKAEWREYIKEAQLIEKEFERDYVDLRGFKFPKEFLDSRKKKYVKTYNTLNKEAGDITIAYARDRVVGYGITFDKKALPLISLKSFHFLTVYFTDRIEAEKFNRVFEGIGLRIALVGEREVKKLKGFENFKNMQEFTKTRLFRKWATAQKIAPIRKMYDTVLNHASFDIVLDLVAKKYSDDLKEFKTYENKYNVNIHDDEFRLSLKATAEEGGYYDLKMLNKIERVEEQLKRFSFIEHLNFPKVSYYAAQEEKLKEYKPIKKLIYQMLLSNKLREKTNSSILDELAMMDIILSI